MTVNSIQMQLKMNTSTLMCSCCPKICRNFSKRFSEQPTLMTSVSLKMIFYIHFYRKQNFISTMKTERFCSVETLATPTRQHAATTQNTKT